MIIGESRYGKSVLDRVWQHDRPLTDALRSGLLAFQATHSSSREVDYPIDCVLYSAATHRMHERRFEADELEPLADYWNQAILEAFEAASGFVHPLYKQLLDSPSAGRSRGAPPLRLQAPEHSSSSALDSEQDVASGNDSLKQ